jgi:hypothetical protein
MEMISQNNVNHCYSCWERSYRQHGIQVASHFYSCYSAQFETQTQFGAGGVKHTETFSENRWGTKSINQYLLISCYWILFKHKSFFAFLSGFKHRLLTSLFPSVRLNMTLVPPTQWIFVKTHICDCNENLLTNSDFGKDLTQHNLHKDLHTFI